MPCSDRDFHLAAALQRAEALDHVHLVLLHQELDAFGVLGDDPFLRSQDLRVVDARVFALEAFVGGVLEALPDIGGVEEGFGGDATDVQAGAAELGVLFDDGGFQAVLAGPDGSGIASRPAANDDQIVGHRSSVASRKLDYRRRREGDSRCGIGGFG